MEGLGTELQSQDSGVSGSVGVGLGFWGSRVGLRLTHLGLRAS